MRPRSCFGRPAGSVATRLSALICELADKAISPPRFADYAEDRVHFSRAPRKRHVISRAARPIFVQPRGALRAGVAELVDALDLGSSDASRGGSSPSARTTCGRI